MNSFETATLPWSAIREVYGKAKAELDEHWAELEELGPKYDLYFYQKRKKREKEQQECRDKDEEVRRQEIIKETWLNPKQRSQRLSDLEIYKYRPMPATLDSYEDFAKVKELRREVDIMLALASFDHEAIEKSGVIMTPIQFKRMKDFMDGEASRHILYWLPLMRKAVQS